MKKYTYTKIVQVTGDLAGKMRAMKYARIHNAKVIFNGKDYIVQIENLSEEENAFVDEYIERISGKFELTH